MKTLLPLTILLLFGINLCTQSKLEVDGAIKISNSEGVPQAGAMRFNTIKNDFEGFDGANWKSFTGSGLNGDGIFSGLTCYNGLVRELIEITPQDVDGDGDIDNAGAVVFATDFVVRPRTVDITYSINLVAGDVPDKNKLILILTCDNTENPLVEIHRWSGLNDLGHCVTNLSVQDPNGACN